jgi:nitroimidazol reductase NimA-like FMN-containing flavoprotein (pyridoxamine 5'-phosphate oxidase superfamily)
MPVSFSKEEAYQYLDSRPGWLILTTIGRGGYPHSVPIGYFRIGDDIYVGGRDGTQRLRNVSRNPKVSALVESGGSMQDIRGLLIQGDAEVIREPVRVLELAREAARRRGTAEDQLPKEARPGVAYIRLRPRRFVSWDYTRSPERPSA